MPYRVIVTLKDGTNEGEAEIHNSPTPKSGDEIEVNLKSGRTWARVGSSHTPHSKSGGSAVIEVRAKQI